MVVLIIALLAVLVGLGMYHMSSRRKEGYRQSRKNSETAGSGRRARPRKDNPPRDPCRAS